MCISIFSLELLPKTQFQSKVTRQIYLVLPKKKKTHHSVYTYIGIQRCIRGIHGIQVQP